MKRIILYIFAACLCCSAVQAGDFPEIAGWKQTGKVKKYNPANLWEYINGAADMFLDYGFQELAASDLESGSIVVTANIYNMGSPLNAFGMYRTESQDTPEIIEPSFRGVLFPPYQCLLVKGQYYIKIDAYEGEISEKLGKKLVAAVAQGIDTEGGLPSEFSLLPEKNRTQGSEGYKKSSFLGMSYFTNAVYAGYSRKKQQYTLFCLLDTDGSSGVEEKLKESWKTEVRKGRTFFLKEIPYQGTVGLVRTAQGYAGVAGLSKTKTIMSILADFTR